MRKKLPKRMLRTIEENGDSRHSDMYRWLKLHHAELHPMLSRHRPSWRVVAEEIALAGVTGLQGQKATADSVRRIWQRLSRDLEAEERSRRTGLPVKKPLTRVQAGWRPPVVERAASPEPLPARRESLFAPTPVSPESGTSDDISPEQLRAGLAEVIAKRSGR